MAHSFPRVLPCEKTEPISSLQRNVTWTGLEELAGCCGFTQAQVSSILKHSHARNNRALLFNIFAAMIIHLSDVVLTEQPDLRDEVESIWNGSGCDATGASGRRESKLFQCLTRNVKDETIRVGGLLRKRVNDFFSSSPNGRHFVQTVLFTCLLPTVGFHVLSRTGHTDLLDSFWLRLNNVLHTSGHIKYQELYLFYGFFKSIMPRIMFEDLFKLKPGAMVARVPNFTSGLGGLYDKRGRNYVHQDEALEMLIIRLIKSLNVTMLACLESAGAWLLLVCNARMMLRSVSAATRSYNRTRETDNSEHDINICQRYDKDAVQSATVVSMVNVMRQKGFLGHDHRNAEALRNVFGADSEDLGDKNVQKLILDVDRYGRKSAELHASAILPDVFGALSEEDVKDHFGGKRFKGVWTKMRPVPTAGFVMGKNREKTRIGVSKLPTDRRKALSDRRHAVTRLMTSFTLAEHAALKGGDTEGAEHARRRWQELYSARYLLSPFADAYRSAHGALRHAQKSQVLGVLNLNWMSTGRLQDSSQDMGEDRRSVQYYYDYSMQPFSSVMVDLMNYIWTRETDGSRGNTIFAVTLLSLKRDFRSWFSGRRSKNLQQLHLHIDDPTLVIPQKRGEQERRDCARDMSNDVKLAADEALYNIGFLLPITVPWGTLLKSRTGRDPICSSHLFCGAAAALGLAEEYGLSLSVYLYGGCFCFRGSCVGTLSRHLIPELALRDDACEQPRDGEVMLKISDGNTRNEGFNEGAEEDPLLRVPRSKVLRLSTSRGLEITDTSLHHGETETRFVSSFRCFVRPVLEADGFFHDDEANRSNGRLGDRTFARRTGDIGCVILSKDTDVTMILAQATCMHGANVVHVLGDNVIEIDTLLVNLKRVGINYTTLSCVYVIAGCDFTAGTYGVSHEHYLKASVRYKQYLGSIGKDSEPDVFEFLTLFAYFEKYGITHLANEAGKEALRDRWVEETCETKEVRKRMREVFSSRYDVGSKEWRLDVRKFFSDAAKSAMELVPLSEHIQLQAQRAKFIVFKYWGKADQTTLTTDVVQGCEESFGFNEVGEVLLEREEDTTNILKLMRELFARCGCKGDCSNRQCTCVKRSRKCVGCDCDAHACKNKVTVAAMDPLNETVDGDDEDKCTGEKRDVACISENRFEPLLGNLEMKPATCNGVIDLPHMEPDQELEQMIHRFIDE